MAAAGPGGFRRLRVPSREDFTSPVHDPRVVARVGLFLGIAITTAFLTGLISHLHQNPIAWLPIPPEPAWGYRLSQGLHTAAGIAAIPLLLAKLYAAYPAFFERPALRGPLHALERGSVGLLVATSVFQLVTGLLNTFQWYPWDFGFVAVHYAVAWVLMGSIVVHVAVKLPTIVAALRRPTGEPGPPEEASHPEDQRPVSHPDDQGPVSEGADQVGPRMWVSADRAKVEAEHEAATTRRGFLEATALAVLGLTALTVGQGVPALSPLAVLAPRQSGVGPQGVPVNKTAGSARVEESAVDPAWLLTVVGPSGTTEFSRADLEAMPQSEAALAIACVEGWSTTAHWSGVPVRDLIAAVSGPDDGAVRVVSLQPRGAYRQSVLPSQYVRHPDTLLALRLNGEDLSLDHGFPARIIAPNRPGVLQTKWVSRLEVIPA